MALNPSSFKGGQHPHSCSLCLPGIFKRWNTSYRFPILPIAPPNFFSSPPFFITFPLFLPIFSSYFFLLLNSHNLFSPSLFYFHFYLFSPLFKLPITHIYFSLPFKLQNFYFSFIIIFSFTFLSFSFSLLLFLLHFTSFYFILFYSLFFYYFIIIIFLFYSFTIYFFIFHFLSLLNIFLSSLLPSSLFSFLLFHLLFFIHLSLIPPPPHKNPPLRTLFSPSSWPDESLRVRDETSPLSPALRTGDPPSPPVKERK